MFCTNPQPGYDDCHLDRTGTALRMIYIQGYAKLDHFENLLETPEASQNIQKMRGCNQLTWFAFEVKEY